MCVMVGPPLSCSGPSFKSSADDVDREREALDGRAAVAETGALREPIEGDNVVRDYQAEAEPLGVEYRRRVA
jgi:hypothetical protein